MKKRKWRWCGSPSRPKADKMFLGTKGSCGVAPDALLKALIMCLHMECVYRHGEKGVHSNVVGPVKVSFIVNVPQLRLT